MFRISFPLLKRRDGASGHLRKTKTQRKKLKIAKQGYRDRKLAKSLKEEKKIDMKKAEGEVKMKEMLTSIKNSQEEKDLMGKVLTTIYIS